MTCRSPRTAGCRSAVAHQYCGALGKRANCQVAVSVHAVSDTASCPLQWRLFLPEEWARRHRPAAGGPAIPAEVGHREKWRLALDTLDELAGWGLVPPVVVADAGYGQNADFRAGLAERGHRLRGGGPLGCDRPPARRAAHAPPPWSGNGRRPQPRYRDKPPSVAALAAGHRTAGLHRGDLAGRVPRADALALPGAAGAAGRGRAPSPGPGRRHGRARPLGRCPARSAAAGRMARRRRRTHRLLAVQPARTTPRSPNWSAWPRSAGASSTTTANSSTAWAWTTSRAAPGPAGTTTSPWSPPPTPSSPNSAWPQKPIHRTHPLPDPRRPPGPAELLDRHLHHLPPTPAQHDHHNQDQDRPNGVLLDESFQMLRVCPGTQTGRPRSLCDERPGHPADRTVREDRRRDRRYPMAGPTAAADGFRAGHPGRRAGAAGLHLGVALAAVRRHSRLGAMFPYLPQQPGWNKRLRAALPLVKRAIRLAGRRHATSGSTTTGSSTPRRWSAGGSRPTVKRSDMAGWAGYGYCASHSRFFWGLRLYLVCTPAGHADPVGAGQPEARTSGRCWRRCWTSTPDLVADRPGLLLIADKGFASKEFETDLAERGIELLRPSFKREKKRARRADAEDGPPADRVGQRHPQRPARPGTARRPHLRGRRRPRRPTHPRHGRRDLAQPQDRRSPSPDH